MLWYGRVQIACKVGSETKSTLLKVNESRKHQGKLIYLTVMYAPYTAALLVSFCQCAAQSILSCPRCLQTACIDWYQSIHAFVVIFSERCTGFLRPCHSSTISDFS